MNAQLLFACVMAVLALIGGIAFLIRHERDAYLGRKLREAAGTEERARQAIEDARMSRELAEALLARKAAAAFNRVHRPNVVRFAPRVTSRGRPLHFEPPSAA